MGTDHFDRYLRHSRGRESVRTMIVISFILLHKHAAAAAAILLYGLGRLIGIGHSTHGVIKQLAQTFLRLCGTLLEGGYRQQSRQRRKGRTL